MREHKLYFFRRKKIKDETHLLAFLKIQVYLILLPSAANSPICIDFITMMQLEQIDLKVILWAYSILCRCQDSKDINSTILRHENEEWENIWGRHWGRNMSNKKGGSRNTWAAESINRRHLFQKRSEQVKGKLTTDLSITTPEVSLKEKRGRDLKHVWSFEKMEKVKSTRLGNNKSWITWWNVWEGAQSCWGLVHCRESSP